MNGMQRRLAKTAVALAVLVAGCGRGLPRGLEFHDLGSCRVGVATRPDPPATGENELTIVARDANGAALRGAGVEVVVWMPAMGAMPYMESRGRVSETSPGVYRARYALAMAGDWNVDVRVKPRDAAPAAGGWRVSTNLKGVAFAGGETRPAETTPLAAAPDTAAPAGDAAAGGAVDIDAARRQSLGIKVEPVAMRDLVVEIRAAGRVAYDETRQAEVSPKIAGWVRSIRVDFTGQSVRRGETLFEIYSPELWSAQQEYLEARQAAREDSARGTGGGGDLADAAGRRLKLWDLSDADLAAIARAGRPRETLPVRSPVSGVVTAKNVVLGSPVTAGQVLYSIAPIDPIWVLASVDEQDLPRVRPGMAVTLTPPGGDRARQGKVAFIAPELAADTRTGTVRVQVANADGRLKPGMYVDARLEVPLGRRLAIPESAVLPTGERRVVFVDLGQGRLGTRDVTLGARAAGWYEVTGGLAAGERVVTSGNFLVAAESRLRTATGKW